MFRASRSISSHKLYVCLAISYTLLWSFIEPVWLGAAQARLKSVEKYSSASHALSSVLQQAGVRHRDGELLVRFRAGSSEQDKAAAVASHGAQRKKHLRGESNVEKFELTAGQDLETVSRLLLLNPAVEFAEPNFLINKDQISPTDPEFATQWALQNTGQNGSQYGSDINVTAAWQLNTGSPSTTIAVIDSGIDFSHPDLMNNQWTNPAPGPEGDIHGWDYVVDGPVIKDEQGHGTSVAGIIAAEGNNATGISGVMWRASLMSLRVLDNTGSGDIASAVEAIDYASAHRADVINLSWGTNAESSALKDAIQRAIRRGVVVVCSAGNEGQDLSRHPYYPASFNLPGLISVAATDGFDQLTSWSNWGSAVTIAAPGKEIYTTKAGGGYWSVSGTSAAAPLVSGVVGLIKTSRRNIQAQNVQKILTEQARHIASLTGRVSAWGVVNAAEGLASLHGTRNPHSPNAPRAFPTPGYGSGGTGPGGSFSITPPERRTGPPAGLPNGRESRDARPSEPEARPRIESNLMCADCDPQGGGGGAGYYPSGDPNFSTARRKPQNETGQSGVDLGSRNFNWSLPLVNLPGRAGLDLNLTLYYNSLVWTKDGGYIKYNADLGSPAPGFRLGLPILQQRFLNSQTGTYAYLMITPSGSRIELRQVSANIYESQDSSYTQLDDTNPNALLVRTTDGTQFSFVPVTVNNEFRCNQIKDRNGNYISATYNTTNGHLLTVTDTLGRVINFNYDGSSNLSSITQTWGAATHTWATFYYTSVYVAPSFGGGLVVNGPNNTDVTVLDKVNLHDGSYIDFDYNSAFGQVNRITRYAADNHVLSYVSYNMSSAAGQTDCPRFTERRDSGESGVMNQTQEVLTSYSVAADGSWSQQTTADGTIYKEIFYVSGWQAGLPQQTETWSGGVRKKWTTIAWTQDDTGLGFQKNPRVTETNVYDAEGNRRRIVVSYYPVTSFSLPSDVYEYAADGTTLLRQSHTDYQLNSAYTDRRIIGLVFGQFVYDGNGNLQSKLLFHHDWVSPWLVDQGAAVQHDNANYGAGFAVGRANLVLIERYDAHYPNDTSRVISEKFGYNTNGCVIFIGDGLWHRTDISYTDAFSDGISRNTFAYPTSVTDPDSFSTTSQYNFDFGALTRTQDPKGAVQTITYDGAARVSQVTNLVNNAYIRWVYPAAMNFVEQFATIQNGAGEAYSTVFFDGWGRVRATRDEHPGSAGGYRGQYVQYNEMGQITWTSNPAEITLGWIPTGDDTDGWIATTQTYDWKGRPLLTTNPDGSTTEASYGGCGCAGGEVTTIRDERGRRRRFTKDVAGRLKQVDELNWDQSVYSTTSYTYNARDQITNINQAGQTRAFSYDGYGRLSAKTTPEQGTTTYSYFADDQIQTITDARGASTTFSYNSRDLPTGITYSVPAGVAATAPVSFAYDEAGNRTSMNDGLGSMSYAYDTLSRMTSETRTFAGLGSYTLSYDYNLSGELTRITNPWNAQVGYGYDKVGRLTNVSGANYSGVSSYINSIAYRAFEMKQMAQANGRTLSLQYDNRMRLSRWDVPGVMSWEYNYSILAENSFRVSYARNLYDATLDRSFDYDHLGRLNVSHSGAEARAHVGLGSWGTQDGPYSHHYAYDQFGNITYRAGWGGINPSYGASYTNNRLNGFVYDATGNLIDAGGGWTFTYDATGQQATSAAYNMQQYYDGNRLRGKKVENSVPTYYLRSTVLGGQVVAEINNSGGWQRGYVYAGTNTIAVQYGGVYWVNQDPFVKSKRVTDASGNVVSTVELDPWGGETNRSSNEAFQPKKFTTYERDVNGSDEAMHRRYNRWWSRFEQPDPYDGSYALSDPQSFNRYAYTQNDPVNFVDPNGLLPCWGAECGWGSVSAGFWGAGDLMNRPRGEIGTAAHDLPIGLVQIYTAELRMWPLALQGDGFQVNYRFYSIFDSWDRAWSGFLGGMQNPDDELASNIVANGVEAALQVLQNGCFDEQQQWNQDVKPANRYFASVQNANNYTKGWSSSFSGHARGVKESPSIGSHTVSVVRPDGTVDPMPTAILNAAGAFNFVVKYYPGQGMAVTSNSLSISHLASVPGYTVGLDPNVNVRWAQTFLDAAPRCKK